MCTSLPAPEKTAFVFSQDNEVCGNLKFLAGPQFGLSYNEVPNPSSPQVAYNEIVQF